MSTNWGTNGIGGFIEKQHSQPSAAIDPTKITLPKGSVICIVGASRGIGAGIAMAYAKAGAHGIILASRRISGLEETAAACKAINSEIRAHVVSCDISKAEDVAALSDTVKQLFKGQLDVVAVNSGYSGPVKLRITDTDPETFLGTAQVNYVGTFLCAKYLVPLLLASPSPDSAKAFIAVSSFASLIVRGPIANTQYCVSKLAQLKLMEHLHEQYHELGLTAYSIHPGAVNSEMANDTSPEEFKKFLTDSPELCGAFCTWLTNSKSGPASWLSGRLLSAKWDVDELVTKKEAIENNDLLKIQVSV